MLTQYLLITASVILFLMIILLIFAVIKNIFEYMFYKIKSRQYNLFKHIQLKETKYDYIYTVNNLYPEIILGPEQDVLKYTTYDGGEFKYHVFKSNMPKQSLIQALSIIDYKIDNYLQHKEYHRTENVLKKIGEEFNRLGLR